MKRSNTSVLDQNHYVRELEQINLILNKILELSDKCSDTQIDSSISQLENVSTHSKILVNEIDSKPTLSADMLEMIHHNLRTPLTSIKAYTDLIMQEKFGTISDLQKTKLRIVSCDIENMQNVIARLFQNN